MRGFHALFAALVLLPAGLRGSEGPGGAAAGVRVDGSGDAEAGRASCPGRCRCELDGLLLRVDCSDLELRAVPSDLSVFTSYLDLSMNNMTLISAGALSSLHFLQELRLPGNDLSFIPKGAFAGLYNLKVLMLQNNQLRSVPAEAFNNLHNLQSLRLDANHISGVPAGSFSGLRSLRHLWLDDNALTEVPAEALSELPALQAMTLALNHIRHVPDHAFSALGRLVVLHLNNNRIVSMGTNCFHGLHSLETLDLNYNQLMEFPTAIRSLRHLKELFFYDNPIQSVGRTAFQNLPELRTLSLNGAAELNEFPDLTGTRSLESLTITGARITSLPTSVCEQLPNLQLLDLSYNQIQSLPSFSACESLQKLDLHHNEVEALEENTFTGLTSLRFLDLSWNRLSTVKPNGFSALPALNRLDLSSNQLSSLPLSGLQTLTHLRLAGNGQLMELIAREDLPRVRWMELPYAFQCCAFISCDRKGGSSWEKEEAVEAAGRDAAVLSSQAEPDWEDFLMEFEDGPKPQHAVHCSPTPGPLRPCRHLLGSWMIRGGVWLMAGTSLISNSLVVLAVFFSPASLVTPTKLLIGLLALVNGLMGVWGGWLAAVDAWTFGSFWRFGAKWESSFLCHLSSFLCVFASQTGLFLLTVAALERCVASAVRSGGRSAGWPLWIRLSICLCFLLGAAITLPPLVAGNSSTSFCLPLPSVSSSLAFSVSMVLFDSLCFLLMTLAYIRFYCQSSKAAPACDEEAALTRHVAWLLFSDCLLYLPVAFLSFSSLLRLPAVGPEAAKALLLLVAPLPACVNPLLYLLFNPLAREELASLAKRTCRGVAPSKLWRRAKARGSTLDSDYDEDVEKQSCDSTQGLVAVEHLKEEEESRGAKGLHSAEAAGLHH